MTTTGNTRFVVIVCAAVTVAAAAAAEYPAKPIRLIDGGAVGSAGDIYGRVIASEIGKYMGQQVIVDNRVGAGGIIAYEAVAKSQPDGYTLGHTSFTFISNPMVYAKLPFDTTKDFLPVVQQGTGSHLIAVALALPIRSVQELIEYARAQPGKLSYGTTGTGSGFTLAMELFKSMTGTQILQVNYKSMQQAITDVIAGQIDVVCDDPPSILPHIRAGRIRAIGVTTPKRLSVMPDVPTVAESGLPGYQVTPSAGYVLPAGTPRAITLRLNAEINKALLSQPVIDRFAINGYVKAGGTPEDFAEWLRSETVKWASVFKAAGIKPQ